MALPGEIVAARFPGTCVRCRGKFAAGEQIHYLKATGAEHLACAEKAAAQLAGVPEEDLVRYSVEEQWAPGICRAPRTREIVVALAATSRYYAEDGLSFGLSQDRGVLWAVTARRATPEEAAGLEARERAEEERQRRRAEQLAAWKRLLRHLQETGEKPEAADPQGEQWPAKRNHDQDRVLLDRERGQIWLTVYNGRDGDCWAWSNAGSRIAWVAPLSEEVWALLRAAGYQGQEAEGPEP